MPSLLRGFLVSGVGREVESVRIKLSGAILLLIKETPGDGDTSRRQVTTEIAVVTVDTIPQRCGMESYEYFGNVPRC